MHKWCQFLSVNDQTEGAEAHIFITQSNFETQAQLGECLCLCKSIFPLTHTMLISKEHDY